MDPIPAIAGLLGLSPQAVAAASMLFLRISAMMAVLPGLGESTIPARVRIGATLALTALALPVADITPPPPGLVVWGPRCWRGCSWA